MPHVIYADLECLLRSIENCEPNLNNSYRMKDNVHTPCVYSSELGRTHDENVITHYRGIHCIEKFVRAIKIMTMMITIVVINVISVKKNSMNMIIIMIIIK